MLQRMSASLSVMAFVSFLAWITAAEGASGDQLLKQLLSEEKQMRENSQSLRTPSDVAQTFIQRYSKVLDAGDLSPATKTAALIHRGSLYSEQGDCPKAIGDFDEALSINAKLTEAYLLRALCYVASKSLDSAIRDLNQAISLRPKDVVAYRERAAVFEKLKQYDRAIEDYSKVMVLLRPVESSEILELRGDAYRRVRKYDLAIDDYQRAVRVLKRNAEILSPQPTTGTIPRLLGVYGKLGDIYQELGKGATPTKGQ